MERNTGLYITYNDEGQVKKTLVTFKGKTITKDSTVAQEILSFINMSLSPFAEIAKTLDELSEAVEFDDPDLFGMVDVRKFQELIRTVLQVIDKFEEDEIFQGTLLRTMMEDAVPPDDGSAMYIYTTKAEIERRINNILRTQYYIDQALQTFCEGKDLFFVNDFPAINHVETVQILSMDQSLHTEYYFRSLCNYYCYLFLVFMSKDPHVARCQCCGDYFIPKTKKATLYCDRVIKNGKTCKQIAPHLKRKINAENDEVLKVYERTKRKMYKRLERSEVSLNPLPHNLTVNEYYQWLDNATKAKNRYAIGEITSEQALSEIDVVDD